MGERSQKDRCVQHPRPLPHQDQDQACYQGMCEDDLWQGNQGEGEACEDSCESIPSCSTEEADLNFYAGHLIKGPFTVWESHIVFERCWLLTGRPWLYTQITRPWS